MDCLVIGGGAAGLVAAGDLGRYRRCAPVIDDGGSRLAASRRAVSDPERARMAQQCVQVEDRTRRGIRCDAVSGVEVEMADDRVLAFDVLYPALGLIHHCELATGLGARVRLDGQLDDQRRRRAGGDRHDGGPQQPVT